MRDTSRRPRAGWRFGTAGGFAFLIVALWITGWLLHHEDADAIVELTPTQMQWRHGAHVVHGVCAWLLFVLAGRWVWPHIALMFGHRSRRWAWIAGLLVAAVGAVTASTALGLLYGAASWRDPLSALHWAAGLVWPALFVAHGWHLLARFPLRRQPAPPSANCESAPPAANIAAAADR